MEVFSLHLEKLKKIVINIKLINCFYFRTIIEEAVEVSSSSSPTSSQQKTSTVPIVKTSDYSSEDTSPENRKNKNSNTEQSNKKSNAIAASTISQSSQSAKSTTTTTTIITKTTKKHGANLLQGSTSTPKNKAESGAQYLHESFAAQFGGDSQIGSSTNRAKEITQNTLNAEREHQKKSVTVSSSQRNKMTQNISKNSSFGRFFGMKSSPQQQAQNESINDADISDHIAYLEYKKAGEYWK